MSFALGVTTDRIGILATDCRFYKSDMSGPRSDEGGKLWRVPGGWATATGVGPFTGFGKLVMHYCGISDLAQLREAFDKLAEGVEVEEEPESGDLEWREVFVALQETPEGPHLISLRSKLGKVKDIELLNPWSFVTSRPTLTTGAFTKQINSRFGRLLETTEPELLPLVRAVAQLFDEVFQKTGENGTVSPTMDFGVSIQTGRGYRQAKLHGASAELRELSDQELAGRFTIERIPVPDLNLAPDENAILEALLLPPST